ncbi:AAA family ATPase (plasmid) [Mycolicibacterium fortuitum]|nr:AAA family ATPase [Mycolicibacterium fortuitum]
MTEDTMHGQWLLESIQLVNWGGFEGHHRVEVSTTSTLISGATGTGKSTLLDAYIALLMPSRIPFNGASNDNVSGRARGGDQRNVLRYMRGKIDDNRVEGSSALTDQVLRGRTTPTWSAIAATWRTESDQRFTAMRLYYAQPSATRFDDITKRMATIDGGFDLSEVASSAPSQFDPAQLRTRFEGIDFHGSYRAFCTAVCTRLGIGLPGEGERALGLLARIQAGRAVTTVDGLFKSMVLERPKTLAVADDAITHFDDLQASYEAMKTAELQVETLTPITEWYGDWSSAHEDLATLSMLVGAADDHSPSPIQVWATLTERRLIDATIGQLTADRATAEARAAEARVAERATETELAALRDTEPGTVALDELDRTLEQVAQAQQDTEQALKIYRERTTVLGDPPSSAEQFAAAQAAAAQFLSVDYAHVAGELREQRDRAVGRHQGLQARRGALVDELHSLAGRAGVIPAELHNARCLIAEALELDPHEVPFVGELLDMADGFHDWRLAADRALGGLSVTVLIDTRRIEQARVRINTLKLPRRVNFEGAPVDQPIPDCADTAMLPARLRVDETSPFAGWLMTRILTSFDYRCVDDPAQLNDVDRGLTITGQTKSGRRGAHGGSRPPVIGVSNAERRTQLQTELAAAETELAAAAAELDSLATDLDELTVRRDAHRYVADTTWPAVDVAAATAQLDALHAHRTALVEGNTDTGARREELLARRESAARARHLAEADTERLIDELRRLDCRRGELVEPAGAPILADALVARLDDELAAVGTTDLTPDAFGSALARLHATLNAKIDAARNAAARAAKMLTSTFETFQRQWPRPDLGTEVSSYPGYRDIFEDLTAEGLHRRRATFVRDVNDWTGIDLLRLHGAFEEAIDDIESRLNPINDILTTLPFGAGRDRLHITLRHTETPDIAAFRKELKALAGATTAPGDDDSAVHKRFLALARFIQRIRQSAGGSDRDYYLDVRRHVYIEAERRDLDGNTLNVYASLAGKSGGESQELIAFIVGAALRYQLGDAHWPRYAPIILDEGFIKSDAAFAGRAVAAWKGLGFQLIIGAPDDKVNSIEPHVDRILCITKNSHHRSRITVLTGPEPTPSADPSRSRRAGRSRRPKGSM